MSQYSHSIQPVSFREQILLTVACLCTGALVAWLNRFHEVQSSIYKGRYLALAQFLRGEAEQPLLTYPLWGYPLLLSWLPAPEVTSIVLQIILSTVTLLVVYTTAVPYVKFRLPLAILCVLAVPWYALASIKLADIYSASFGVMAVCVLAWAVKEGRVRWTITSGLLFGASLNFRSDFLGILLIIVVLTAVLSPRLFLSNWKRLSLVVALALLMVLPWGLFRVYHDKPFGLTSTNAGMVLYNSLGFPGNAWGITGSDRIRTAEVKAVLGAEVDAASAEGNAFFRRQFLAAVLTHPTEFSRKVAYNFMATLKLGFYTIETWTFLNQKQRLEFEVLKEQLKFLFGARPFIPRIERFRNHGLWNDDFTLASISARQWVILAYPVANSVFSAAYLSLLLIAMGAILAFDRQRLQQPVFLFCMVGTLSIFSLLALLQYEPRQANVLYPLGMPLVVIAIEWGTRLAQQQVVLRGIQIHRKRCLHSPKGVSN